jgi:hypothetical protein
MFLVDFGASEIDQVEVYAFDPCVSQVGSDEIRFADLFGAFEVLLLEIVRIEPRPASLACDAAANKAATGRAEVEGDLAKIRASEVGLLPLDLR